MSSPSYSSSADDALSGADTLAPLHDALLATAREAGLRAQLLVLAPALATLSGGAATIIVRAAAMEPETIVRFVPEDVARVARGEPGTYVETPVTPIRAAVWRRWLRLFERRREVLRAPTAIGDVYMLDLAEPWIRREFGSALCGIVSLDSPFEGGVPQSPDVLEPHGVLVAPVSGLDGGVCATIALDVRAAWPPPPPIVRAVELAGRQVGQLVAHARLEVLAEARAERLQRLQEAGAALARSLDEQEILRELARQVTRLLAGLVDGVVIAHPDLERAVVRTPLRIVRNLARSRAEQPLGTGPIGEAARTGRVVRIDDYDPAHSPLAAADDVVGDGGPAGSVLAAPMRVGTQLLGVLAVHAAATGAYHAEHEELLRAIAALAATAVANARLFAESEAERRQSEALAEVARAVGASLRFGEVMRLVLRHSSALLHARGACVALQRDDYLHIVAGVGSASLFAGVHVPVAGSMMGQALREARHFISNDVPHDDAYYKPLQRIAPIQKAVLVPLVGASGPIGVLVAVNREADFAEADARVLQRLADHVAVAIANARLFEEVSTATREWKVAFDAIAAGMVVLDDAERIVRCNARAAELTGFDGPKALLGRDFREALGITPASESDVIERARMHGEVARATVRAEPNGRRFDVTATPHPDGGAVVTFDDVTAHHALAERYRLVVETGRDAIVITDLGGRVVFANAAAHALFGRGPELLGMPTAALVDADASEVEHRRPLGRTGDPQRYDVVVRRPDGSARMVAVSTAPLGDVGQVHGVVASLRDVTEERVARAALAASESRYRGLFESAADAIYTVDAERLITSVNEATSTLVGVSRAALVGTRCTAFVDADDLALVHTQFEAALRGEPRHFECRITVADGSPRLLSVAYAPLRGGTDPSGARVLAVARDVTAERERAAALERSEARYERLVESASDAIFTTDLVGRFTAVNHALERSTGRRRSELLGADATLLVSEAQRPILHEALLVALRGERVRREITFHDADGMARVGSLVVAPVIEHGAVAGVLGIVRDVTDERRLAEQLMQREKLASVGRLVRGVAHELNNPLTSVVTLAELLVAEADPAAVPNASGPPVALRADDVRDAALAIHAEALRAARIVARLHAFARQPAPERAATDVNRTLLAALDLRRYALRAQEVDIVVALDYELPAIWADAHQLQQAFVHLIAASEHALGGSTGEGCLTVCTGWRGDVLEISIGESGAARAPDDVAGLLEPFAAIGVSAEDGSAMGIALAADIVREHGGHIRIEPDGAVGTTFVVAIPFVRPPEGDTLALDPDAERHVG